MTECPTNKDLVYSTGNSAQCYMAAWMGAEFGGRMDTCICVAESLQCSPETSKTLLISYSESRSVVSDSLCPMDYTVYGFLQARILEGVAFPFSRESSQPRDQALTSCISCIGCIPCISVELHHLGRPRFHIDALIYNICFSLSDSLHSV